MPGEERPVSPPPEGFFKSLEGKSPQINEIIETLHQEGIGTPLFAVYEEAARAPEDTFSRIEAIQRQDTTIHRRDLVGLSFPITLDNPQVVVVMLTNGNIYVLQNREDYTQERKRFEQLYRGNPIEKTKIKSMRNPLEAFLPRFEDPLALGVDFNARTLLNSKDNNEDELRTYLEQGFKTAKELRDLKRERQEKNENLAYSLFKNIFGSDEESSS